MDNVQLFSVSCIILVLLSFSVIAADYDLFADIVKRNIKDDHIKVQLIDTFVRNSIDYAYYQNPRGLLKTWSSKEGDCTDYAIFITYMLRRADVENKLVRGYLDGNKHDYYLYEVDNVWYSMDVGSTMTGYGTW